MRNLALVALYAALFVWAGLMLCFIALDINPVHVHTAEAEAEVAAHSDPLQPP